MDEVLPHHAAKGTRPVGLDGTVIPQAGEKHEYVNAGAQYVLALTVEERQAIANRFLERRRNGSGNANGKQRH